jgi:hypothetical protein
MWRISSHFLGAATLCRVAPEDSLAFLKRIVGRDLFTFFAAAEGILGTVAILPGTAYSLADLPLERSVV